MSIHKGMPVSIILNKLKNRLSEVANDIVASEEIRSSRLNTCLNCEHLIKITRQCSKCFCLVDAKIIGKKNKCPMGKW